MRTIVELKAELALLEPDMADLRRLVAQLAPGVAPGVPQDVLLRVADFDAAETFIMLAEHASGDGEVRSCLEAAEEAIARLREKGR